jgi:hypothetical protein
MLPAEYSKLRALHGACCVSVVEGGLTTVLDIGGEELGAGYLMEDVGQSITVSECFDGHGLSALGSAVFMALQNLHERGYSHGDARIANILRLGETVKWIDMMLSVPVSQTVKRGVDIKTLLESLLPPTNTAAVIGLMQSTAVTTYCKDCSVQNMNQVCAALSVAVLSSSGSTAESHKNGRKRSREEEDPVAISSEPEVAASLDPADPAREFDVAPSPKRARLSPPPLPPAGGMEVVQEDPVDPQ